MEQMGPHYCIERTPDGLALIGEVDLAASREVHEGLVSLLAPGATVTVELSAVTFIDSSGLDALLRAHRHAESNDARLVLRAPSARVHRLFELTGIATMFEIDGAPERGPVD